MGNSQQELARIQQKAAAVRWGGKPDAAAKIIVGTATCGVSAGARSVVQAFDQEISARGITGVAVTETGCSGRCDLEPLVQVMRDGEPPVLYFHVTPEKARRIVQQHIQSGEVIHEWAIT